VKPTIGITSGDPRGIGLEVALKALPHILPAAHWVLFTDREAFASNAGFLDGRFVHRWVEDPRDVRSDGFLHLVSVSCADPRPGARALRYLEAAGDAAMAGAVQAIVTAPVSKEAIGGGFTGQTDWLAARAGIARYAMAFFTPTFKVVLATVHLSLRQALDRISEQLYVDLIPFIDAELRRLGFPRPRIAVAAVNPHAGEGGLFGREDQDLLRPAVDRCRAMGLDVSGPYSADSLYYRAHSGDFDLVLAPYHDQGLAPVKLFAHGQSTNVTLGLPYIRTSPDHGTAFDIAGQGIADPAGMLSALQCAVDLAERQARQRP
jgi:4-hydroxythreonine-4-phosphate dehydrogenase